MGADIDTLPSGTVTFCFTDIEGSTKLFARLGERYAQLLDDHRGLIRDAANHFGGILIETDGDGCFLAFQGAASAVKAAGAMQQAIDQHGWPQDERIRIRVGLHTGEAQPSGRNYVALAVNQAARVADTGHGGQVIVSAQTAANLDQHALSPFHLAELGEYRLRSFDEPCRLFQLAGPGLAGAFPPLRTRTAVSKRVRIFLSSPGDVRAAREIAALTVERLAQDYARHFAVEPYFWDYEAMLAAGQFQDPAEPPSAFDIVVLIVWSRLGPPLPEKTRLREYRGIDERTPLTGTEWEFEEVLRASKERTAPNLLIYRSLSPASFDLRDPQHRDEQWRQLEALDRFCSQDFANCGAFTGTYTEFETDTEFAAALEKQLRELLDKRVRPEDLNSRDRSTKVWMQAPFRGLESYEFEHASIFFGQDEALTKAMVQLSSNAEAGASFLLVLGASGSGKSSLVKAGILPKLFVPRRIPGAAFLRRVVFRPSDTEAGEDLFDALARRLAMQVGPSEGLLELIGHGQSVANLAAHLRNASSEPAYPIGNVLGLLAVTARRDGQMLEYEAAKLVLVIDQLEELFTNESFAPEERQRFVALLAGLVRSGLVWVIATMRNDFMYRAIETPELMRLAEGNGRLELLPPTKLQMSQMIRRPATATGIGFEYHAITDVQLNEVIAEEVAHESGALPLLSYLLDQMYRSDVLETHGSNLTFATYEALGHLEGAIATRAEAVMDSCAHEDRRALGAVLFSLVQMSTTDSDIERAVCRRVPLSNFPPGTPQRRLIEALLHARLLVSDVEPGEAPFVRVAHEALIVRWIRAREFVKGNEQALKIRRRLEERYALWRSLDDACGESSSKRGHILLSTGLSSSGARFGRDSGILSEFDLVDGQWLLREHRYDIEPHLIEYIERSTVVDHRKRRRAIVLSAMLTGTVVILVMLAASFGWIAVKKQYEAELQARQAIEDQSRRLIEAATSKLAALDGFGAQSIMVEVLANKQSGAATSAWAINVFQNARVADRQLAVLCGHRDHVYSALFSPDGRRIVTSSADKTVRIWDASDGVLLAKLSGHEGQVESAAYSADGRYIVSASDDGTARIWDSATNKQITILSGHEDAVESAVFSPDGRRIGTASKNNTVRLWDVASGKQLMTMSGHYGAVESVAFSPDGRYIVSASNDQTARIWDAATGEPRAMLSGHDGAVESAAFSPDGRRIVTASDDHTARIWDSGTGQLLNVLWGHHAALYSAAFSPDGRRIVTASFDNTARIWDSSTGEPLAVLSTHDSEVASAAFSPDGQRIVTALYDSTARIWDASKGAQLEVLSGHTGAVESAAFSPDGRRIVTSSGDKTARIWDAANGKQIGQPLSGHDDAVESAAFSPDGRRIVTASDDHTARIWDVGSGAHLTTLSGHNDFVRFAAFSPDGQRIVSTSDDGTARIWDALSGNHLVTVPFQGHIVALDTFLPDGVRLVTSSVDNTARVWNVATRKQLSLPSVHDSKTVSSTFSTNGQRNATASYDLTQRIRNVLGGTRRTLLSGHDGTVESAAFSPDGRRVATASNDQTARVWDAAAGIQLAVLSGHDGPVESVAFSPDGKRIVTASRDRTARIWDSLTGKQLAILRGHSATVYSAAFSPDGWRVVTASADKTARVWDARIPANEDEQIAWSEAAQTDVASEVWRTLPSDEAVRTWSGDASICDHLAAAPYDPDRLAQGFVQEKIFADSAKDECSREIAKSGISPRLSYELGRALLAKRDPTGARRAFELAASSGYRAAQIDLANILADPSAEMLDPVRAVALYEKAWHDGVPIAAFELGQIYERGAHEAGATRRTAVQPNATKAWVWYRRGADAGEPNALARFGERNDESAVTEGSPAKKDAFLLEAFRYYAEAAERARDEDWLDDVWKNWRYRRATLARLLAQDGMMQQVADVYGQAKSNWRPQRPTWLERFWTSVGF